MRKTAFIRRYRSILTEDGDGDETEETQNAKQQKHQQRKQIRIDKMNPRFRIQIVRQDLGEERNCKRKAKTAAKFENFDIPSRKCRLNKLSKLVVPEIENNWNKSKCWKCFKVLLVG